MLLLLCVILGVLGGLINKGKLSGLVGLKGLVLPIIAFALSSIPAYWADIPYALKAILISANYFCVFAFAVLNRKYILASILTGLGTLCNFAVIAANSFRMPISEYALIYYPDLTAEQVIAKRADYFVAVNAEAKLLILGDVICVKIPYLGGFVSVGDIFLAIGMLVLVFAAMSSAKEKKKQRFYWAPHRH